MTAPKAQFTQSVAEIYDRFTVPLIFSPYAEDLAARVAAAEAQSVLETAAGTGAVTRAMASRLASSVRIVATDLSQAMLDHARASLFGDERITWQQADALALPFADRMFDAVVCQFGVMFFPDKVQGFREARRVLKPGGRFFFSVWDSIGENAFAHAVTQALAELFPLDPPRFMARLPHGYHDTALIRQGLEAAGFAPISIEARDHRSRAPSPYDVAVAFCQGTPLRNEIEVRDAPRLAEITQAVADALARRYGSGSVEGAMKAYVVTAMRPMQTA